MFSPCLTTLQKAIRKDHLVTWLGIESLNFEKSVTNILSAAKGHLDQERANLQSTKQIVTKENFVPTDGIAIKTYKHAAKIMQFEPKETMYTDQTLQRQRVHYGNVRF